MEGRITQLKEDQSEQIIARIGNKDIVAGNFQWSQKLDDEAEENHSADDMVFLADVVAPLPDGSVLVAAYDLDNSQTVLYRKSAAVVADEEETGDTKKKSCAPLTTTDALVDAQEFLKLLGSRRITAMVPSRNASCGGHHFKLLVTFNDGSLIVFMASGGNNAPLRLAPTQTLPMGLGKGPITSAAWSDDDTLIAVALFNASIVIMPSTAVLSGSDAEAPSSLLSTVFRTLSGPTLPVTSLWFLHSTRLLSTSLDKTCRVLDTTTGRTVAAVRLPHGPVSRLYPFTQGVPYALAGTTSGHVILLDTQSYSRPDTLQTSVGFGGFDLVGSAGAAPVKHAAAFATSSTIPSSEFATVGVRLPHCSLLGARPLHRHLAAQEEGHNQCAVMDMVIEPYTETAKERADAQAHQQGGGSAQLLVIRVLYSCGAVEEVPIENDAKLPSFSCPTAIPKVLRRGSIGGVSTCTPRWLPETETAVNCRSSAVLVQSTPVVPEQHIVRPLVLETSTSAIGTAMTEAFFAQRKQSVAAVTTETEELTALCAQLLEQVKEQEVAEEAAAKKSATSKGKGKAAEPKKRPR